ncbi:ECF transporter S component [Acidobacteria bacterium AH-259-G07]|nr:ECF transporter S component [Acidobacteria bacterium AH-259-G07]
MQSSGTSNTVWGVPSIQIIKLLRFFSDPIPSRARLFIFSIILSGSALFFYCFYHSLAKVDLRWLFLVALTFVASSFPVKIPLVKTNTEKLAISMGDAFVFTSILLFGPEVAVMLAAVEGHTANSRAKIKRRYKQLFNLAQLVLVSFIVGHIFYQLEGKPAPLDPAQVTDPARLLAKLNTPRGANHPHAIWH